MQRSGSLFKRAGASYLQDRFWTQRLLISGLRGGLIFWWLWWGFRAGARRISIQMSGFIHSFMHAFMYLFIYIHACICILHICMYICMYTCITYVHAHTNTYTYTHTHHFLDICVSLWKLRFSDFNRKRRAPSLRALLGWKLRASGFLGF